MGRPHLTESERAIEQAVDALAEIAPHGWDGGGAGVDNWPDLAQEPARFVALVAESDIDKDLAIETAFRIALVLSGADRVLDSLSRARAELAAVRVASEEARAAIRAEGAEQERARILRDLRAMAERAGSWTGVAMTLRDAADWLAGGDAPEVPAPACKRCRLPLDEERICSGSGFTLPCVGVPDAAR